MESSTLNLHARHSQSASLAKPSAFFCANPALGRLCNVQRSGSRGVFSVRAVHAAEPFTNNGKLTVERSLEKQKRDSEGNAYIERTGDGEGGGGIPPSPADFLSTWGVDSWKQKTALQLPTYPDAQELETVIKTLEEFPPLVFAGEARSLEEKLAEAALGQAFLLQGGDCAESFKEFNAINIRDTFRVILQMGVVLMFGGQMPVIKVGRMAGQFAKPRSEDFEVKDGVKLPSYRGDNINGDEFNEKSRIPDPNRMIRAYSQAAATLNLLRSFATGGYAAMQRVTHWNLDFTSQSEQGSRYRELANRVDEALGFMGAVGLTPDHPLMTSTGFWTSHECLLLPFEQAMTRLDSTTGQWYDCSAHMLWVGERTRNLDGGHLEFLRGLANPLGVKLDIKKTWTEPAQELGTKMAFYKDTLLQLTDDGYMIRPSYMDAHISHQIRCTIGQMRTSSHQLEIETGRYRRIPAENRICQLCHIEPETELHYICHCPVYYEIRGRFHCLFREGFGPLARVMEYQDQKCLGLFLLELQRHRESLLRGLNTRQNSQSEINDSFRADTRQPEEQASQQSPNSTYTGGILADRAIELGKARRPHLRGQPRHRQKLLQKIRIILARHGRRPIRALSMKDIDGIRRQPMLDILEPRVCP